MLITSEQKRVIDSTLSIFETGRLPSAAAYETCTILNDGAGISYGKHQCTDRAGSLDAVVKEYIARGGQYAEQMKAFLPMLAANESTKAPPKGPWPTNVTALVQALRLAGRDPIMQEAQDVVFDRDYFAPAQAEADKAGLTLPLGLLALYDTCIHSGPGRVATHRAAFPQKAPCNGGDEKAWIIAYLETRKAWLAASSNPLVRKTVYRPAALLSLAAAEKWTLTTPCAIRGVVIL